jgi:hypothetical protein
MNKGSLIYPKHHPWELEPYYCLHVSAMTAEALHSKADIAEQLAWRDKRIAELEAKYAALVAAARLVLELASLSVPKMRICDTPDNAFESMCALRALLPQPDPRSVACPFCGAPAGTLCLSDGDDGREEFHMRRIRAAEGES